MTTTARSSGRQRRRWQLPRDRPVPVPRRQRLASGSRAAQGDRHRRVCGRPDVLTVGLHNAHLPGGLVPYSSKVLPAGMAAYWSLAEVLRRSAKRLLDIDPQELEFGLYPTSQGSMTVFIADALDNGAGYAAELGSEDNLEDCSAPPVWHWSGTGTRRLTQPAPPLASTASALMTTAGSMEPSTGGSPSTCWTC